MDSYDNDIFLLFLDDDLFWKEDDDECGSSMSQIPLEPEQLIVQ